MLIELQMVTASRCQSCGERHRFRLALTRAEPPMPRGAYPDESVLVGFFARCPKTEQETWSVVELADTDAGRARLIRVGPADLESWEPSDHFVPMGVRKPAAERTPDPLVELPRCATAAGGPRDEHRVPESLRRTLGCPFYTHR
jgi:hypothetical protein